MEPEPNRQHPLAPSIRALREQVGKLAPQTESFLVILVAFAWPMARSLWTFLTATVHPVITEGHLRQNLILEPAMLTALGAFLWLRGWSLRRLGLNQWHPTGREAFEGFALFLVAQLIVYVAFLVLYLGLEVVALIFTGHAVTISGLSPGSTPAFIARGFTLPTVLAESIINPIFEEVLVCGYIIAALRDRRGLKTAFVVSVVIRTTYHLYQGVYGAVSILMLGILAAWWYARQRTLWPVIVAHGLFDFVGLIAYLGR